MSGTEETNQPISESVFKDTEKPRSYSWNDKWKIGTVLFFLSLIIIGFLYDIYSEINSLILNSGFSNKQVLNWLIEKKYMFFLIFPIMAISGIAIKRTVGWVLSSVNFYFFITIIIIAEIQLKTDIRPILIELTVITIALINILLLNMPALKKFYKLNHNPMLIRNLIAFILSTLLSVFLRFS